MKKYVGMNFKKWCSLDEDDETTLNVELHYEDTIEHYTSNENIDGMTMLILQNSVISEIDFKNGEWFIVLNFNY